MEAKKAALNEIGFETFRTDLIQCVQRGISLAFSAAFQ
jgi:hypothetical protein